MSDIEERINALEIKYGTREVKEPTNLEEFLEQYPDYEELIHYISPKDREILNKYSAMGTPSGHEKVLPTFEGWSEAKIQRAKRCLEYYSNLHPEGIRGKAILDKYEKLLMPNLQDDKE